MIFVADILALNTITKEIVEYVDTINIPNCNDIDEANIWCQTNGKGYMNITGFFEDEIIISELLINKNIIDGKK